MEESADSNKPKWDMIVLISLALSLIVSSIQTKFWFRSNEFLKYFGISTITSIAEFAIFINLYGGMNEGFNGIGESVLNLFVLNPLSILCINYFVHSMMKRN